MSNQFPAHKTTIYIYIDKSCPFVVLWNWLTMNIFWTAHLKSTIRSAYRSTRQPCARDLALWFGPSDSVHRHRSICFEVRRRGRSIPTHDDIPASKDIIQSLVRPGWLNERFTKPNEVLIAEPHRTYLSFLVLLKFPSRIW